jgi:putative peptidoglycan lipid II flippase
MAINILLSLLLIRLFAGLGWRALGGLALANSLAVTIEMVILLVLLRPLMGGMATGRLGPALIKMGLAALGMAVVLQMLLWGLPFLPGWLVALAGIGLGGVTYLGLAYLLGMEELRNIQRRMLRRVR